MNKPFVIILDDEITSNKVTELVIRKTLGEVKVKLFASPDVAFEFIIN